MTRLPVVAKPELAPWRINAPPEAVVLRPALAAAPPPLPDVPLPTVMRTAPPLPPVEAPEPTEHEPEFPREAVPALKVMHPETPVLPLFTATMRRIPLVRAVPSPDTTSMAPPVWLRPRPAMLAACPPCPLVPLPAANRMEPARPPVAAPDPTLTAPAFASAAEPELKTSAADEPRSPALGMATRMKPLVEMAPSPAVIARHPPVPLQARPATARATSATAEQQQLSSS